MLTYSAVIAAISAAVVVFRVLPWVIMRAEKASSPASPEPRAAAVIKTARAYLSLFRIEIRRKENATPTELTLPPGASFDVKNSWATTLTAFITAVAVAAAAFSDKFDAIVDKPYAAEFALASGLFGATALLAPIVYQAFQEIDANGRLCGTTAGLKAASFLTLTAALGALCAAAGLVLAADRLPDTVQVAWTVGIGIVMILVAMYVVRSLSMLTTAKDAVAVEKLTTLITVSCCGPKDQPPTVRLTLL